MTVLLHPGYFPNVAQFAVLAQYDVLWEVHDHYQKQTFRNRCYICTDRGRFMMNIPIQHVGSENGKQFFKEVRPDATYPWQRQHWRTLQTAYRTSPFFEYYEDDIAPLFEEKFNFLLDFNLQTIATVCNCLQIPMPKQKTKVYEPIPVDGILDARHLIHPKAQGIKEQEPYIQVFGSKHGFIQNMSVLDLLFNEGPHALQYLRNQKLPFLNA